MVAQVLERPTLVLNRNWQPVNVATVARSLVRANAAGAAPWKNNALLVSGANDSDNNFEGYTSAAGKISRRYP